MSCHNYEKSLRRCCCCCCRRHIYTTIGRERREMCHTKKTYSQFFLVLERLVRNVFQTIPTKVQFTNESIHFEGTRMTQCRDTGLSEWEVSDARIEDDWHMRKIDWCTIDSEIAGTGTILQTQSFAGVNSGRKECGSNHYEPHIGLHVAGGGWVKMPWGSHGERRKEHSMRWDDERTTDCRLLLLPNDCCLWEQHTHTHPALVSSLPPLLLLSSRSAPATSHLRFMYPLCPDSDSRKVVPFWSLFGSHVTWQMHWLLDIVPRRS